MNRIFHIWLIVLFFCGAGFAEGCGIDGIKDIDCIGVDNDGNKPAEEKAGLDLLLDGLRERTENLKSYDANVVSAFIQPLLEARTVRRGKIYYVNDSNESKLRMNFLTRQDDDVKPQADRQDYLFDGVWLMRVNYTTGHVEKRQLARENEPKDVLGLVSSNFPLIGFSNVDELKKDFEIELVEDSGQEDRGKLKHVRLEPLEGTKFAEEYQQIDFWVDMNAMLPVRIDSLTVEEDIYQLTFEGYRVNESLDLKFFKLEYPEDFTVEVKELEVN